MQSPSKSANTELDITVHASVRSFLVPVFFILVFVAIFPPAGALDPDTAGWTPATSSAEFGPRFYMGTADFAGKLWIIGGSGPSGYMNDVWSSDDGVNWHLVTAHADFSPRSTFATTVFDNRLWVVGGEETGGTGLNDAWYSSDGVTWIQATPHAAFLPRVATTLTVFDGKMWLVGGGTKSHPMQSTWDNANDVWFSQDGITWTEATANAGFLPRSSHTAASFGNRLWIFGGWNGNTMFNDIWYSSDGITWMQARGGAAFPARDEHKTAVFDNKIWTIGGYSKSGHLNDVWYSADGRDWRQAGSPVPFDPRRAHAVVAFNNRLWVIGGVQESTIKSDVWYLSDPRSPDVLLPDSSVSEQIVVSKSISPVSIKPGTDAVVTIVLNNTGTAPVHDIELLDTTIPEFPVISGETQYASLLQFGPGETRRIQYTVHATKPGRYVLNKTLVMYAGDDGNYHRTSSGAPVVVVLESLIPPASGTLAAPQTGIDRFFSDFMNMFIRK